MHTSKKETGSVLLIALLVMTAISVLGVLAIQSSIIELNLVRNERDIQETFYLSESAALEGVQLLSNLKAEDRQDRYPIWLHSRKKLAAMNLNFRDASKWHADEQGGGGNSIKSRFNSDSLISAVEWDIVSGGSLVMTEPRLVLIRVYGLCMKYNANQLIEIGYVMREP